MISSLNANFYSKFYVLMKKVQSRNKSEKATGGIKYQDVYIHQILYIKLVYKTCSPLKVPKRCKNLQNYFSYK